MLRTTALAAALAASSLFTGCASIVSGQNQSLSVATKNSGADVPGAKCSLANDKGTWFVTTPGSVTVRRSYNDLAVNCALDGLDPGLSMVKSSTKGMAFGNILFGGLIGAGVDISTGAAYDYPEIIVVDMGAIKDAKEPAKDDTAAKGNAVDAKKPASTEPVKDEPKKEVAKN